MTETVQARCHFCATELAAVGAPCPRCVAPAGLGAQQAPPRPPFPSGPFPQGPSAAPFAGGPYAGGPQYFGAPHPGAPYGAAPHAGPAYPPPYAGSPYPGGPQPYGMSFPGAAPAYGSPRKEVAIAIILSILWIGAGHLYLGRVGAGAALMAAHFFLGLIFLVVFAPLGFLLWVGGVIWCCIWCSNLTAAINAGTAPRTATW